MKDVIATYYFRPREGVTRNGPHRRLLKNRPPGPGPIYPHGSTMFTILTARSGISGLPVRDTSAPSGIHTRSLNRGTYPSISPFLRETSSDSPVLRQSDCWTSNFHVRLSPFRARSSALREYGNWLEPLTGPMSGQLSNQKLV
jgi:hypothetical protein